MSVPALRMNTTRPRQFRSARALDDLTLSAQEIGARVWTAPRAALPRSPRQYPLVPGARKEAKPTEARPVEPRVRPDRVRYPT